MIDCPHCFRSVFPTNGICPGCQRNVVDRPDHDLVAVEIAPKTDLGHLCYLCNVPTSKIKKVEDWTTSEYYDPDKFSVLRLLFSGFSGLFLPVFVRMPAEGGMSRSYKKITFRIPVCANCKSIEIRIIESIPERGHIRIASSKEFSSRIMNSTIQETSP